MVHSAPHSSICRGASNRWLWATLFALVVLPWGLGCGYLSGNKPAEEVAEDLEEEEPDPKLTKQRTAKSSAQSAESMTGDLSLKIKEGDRFPLLKVIDQRLTQPEGDGTSVGVSHLEMLLAINVEELRDRRKRFGVRYHRIRFQQDVAGQHVEYNSTQSTPTESIPPEALVYAGLVNNGFSFWVGPDNQLIDVVGYKEFVERCVRDIPASHRQAVLEQLTALNRDEGIANFVDDSIGLLPSNADPKSPGVSVRMGSDWRLQRKIDGPAPMLVSTRCLLRELNERVAVIELFGSITAATPAPSAAIANDHKEWRVTVRNGSNLVGSCTVDRATGLPTNCRVERYLDLLVTLPDGTEIPQRKEIITTINAFLEQAPRSIGEQRREGNPALVQQR